MSNATSYTDEQVHEASARALATGYAHTADILESLAQERMRLIERINGVLTKQAKVHVGESHFETWFADEFTAAGKGVKQQMREAYEAGMNDLAAHLSQVAQACTECEPDGVFDTNGNGPFDCYACGKKAQGTHGEAALPDPWGCNACTHPDCGRYNGPRQVECRAMRDNACAREYRIGAPAKHAAVPDGWRWEIVPIAVADTMKTLRVETFGEDQLTAAPHSAEGARVVADGISKAPTKLRGLAQVIRKHGTCAAAALEHVADEIAEAITAAPTLAGKEG